MNTSLVLKLTLFCVCTLTLNVNLIDCIISGSTGSSSVNAPVQNFDGNVRRSKDNKFTIDESMTIDDSAQRSKHKKFTIDELMTMKFPNRISEDIDTDPCKSRKYYQLMIYLFLFLFNKDIFIFISEVPGYN